MKTIIIFIISLFAISANANENAPIISDESQECIDCHATITPGIVGDWEKSRHAITTMEEASAKSELEKRISISEIPESMSGNVIGCAECHLNNPESHKDTFEHFGYSVHTIVSSDDCAVCHPKEQEEYSHNLMANAYSNLVDNPLYQTMVNSVTSTQMYNDSGFDISEPNHFTEMASCLACHGTKIEVEGFVERETELGELSFPVLKGWPNQGVGRIDPDGSVGSCTSCHPRHEFSIEVARKPYTCSQCHKGPDVPAYKIYEVSKHGNIFSSNNKDWDFDHVPWTIGEDFTAPTCATCHISLLVDSDETVIAERTHRMNDRLDKRLFGLIYAHPHPVSGNTSIIKNNEGLPLPTSLTGEYASDYLIDEVEQVTRRNNMKNICRSCHSSGWVDGHFDVLDKTIEETNAMTLSATKLMIKIWENNLADNSNIFDEAIEKEWVEQWLFYANSTRMSAAMSGADYGVFADGRWQLSKNLREIHDWYELRMMMSK